MIPVARLQETPVAALEKLVHLYFDPDIASPRKVSVWYSVLGRGEGLAAGVLRHLRSQG